MLVIGLIVLGTLLTASVIPGPFSVDDCNYLVNVLALRHGSLTVVNTAGLQPSAELLFFDPGPWGRSVASTPVASTAPPLYALLATPFSMLGWRGLVGLNTIAYLFTIVLVFVWARCRATEALTPWLAAVAFGLGGYALEYAIGLWPHALSVALCTAGLAAADRALRGQKIEAAAVGGVLLALAAGLRYQNVVLLAATGAGVAWWSRRGWRAAVAFALAAMLPLAASSGINRARLGSWNPVSKGKGYLALGTSAGGRNSARDAAVLFWSHLIDYSVRPTLSGGDVEWDRRDPATGAHLMLGVTSKKAFVQSAPWAALGLIGMVAAWLPSSRLRSDQRATLRLLSLPTAAVVATFAVAGLDRHDGLAFNERYLLELLPLASLGFAWSLDGLGLRLKPLAVGASLGVALVLAVLLGTPIVGGSNVPLWVLRQEAILKAPLAMAMVLCLVWMLHSWHRRAAAIVAAVAGICLGWGLTLHLLDDVAASQWVRGAKAARTAVLAEVLPARAAYLAYRGFKDSAAPLLFDHDIVILDLRADEGKDAATLVGQLLRQGRRVFLSEDGIPPDVLARVTQRFTTTRLTPGGPLVELTAATQ